MQKEKEKKNLLRTWREGEEGRRGVRGEEGRRGREPMIKGNKREVIPFKDFMSRPATTIRKETPLQSSIYSFFPVITVGDFLPLHDPAFALFFIGASLVAAIAFCEKVLAMNGFTDVSGNISRVTSLLFPVVSYAALFWFIFFGMRG